jgi:hypothetical protein
MRETRKPSDLHLRIVSELAELEEKVLNSAPIPRVESTLSPLVYHPHWIRSDAALLRARTKIAMGIDRLYMALANLHWVAVHNRNRVEAQLLLVERRHTFSMLTHKRIGKNAILGRLPIDLIERLFTDSISIEVDSTGGGSRFTKYRNGVGEEWIEEVD